MEGGEREGRRREEEEEEKFLFVETTQCTTPQEFLRGELYMYE
jgi:hypothetical protein